MTKRDGGVVWTSPDELQLIKKACDRRVDNSRRAIVSVAVRVMRQWLDQAWSQSAPLRVVLQRGHRGTY